MATLSILKLSRTKINQGKITGRPFVRVHKGHCKDAKHFPKCKFGWRISISNGYQIYRVVFTDKNEYDRFMRTGQLILQREPKSR